MFTESITEKLEFSAMARTRKRRFETTLFIAVLVAVAFGGLVSVSASLPYDSPRSQRNDHRHHHHQSKKMKVRKFEIAEDMFWKDGKPFQIIGGDLHYFRVLPQYWEDRLLRVKALGLNTIQTYVPWNLHEPEPGKLNFDGIADLISFLKLCQKLDLLVMLRAGPYICGEWDLGGFPPWLLAIKPVLKLRSSDPAFLQVVKKWWGILLPEIFPLLYNKGGPIVMIQVENEFGSYGDDKAYLHYLVNLARAHLGRDVILYTTDSAHREHLERGTIKGGEIFTAVDFSTGEEPWPKFELQKEYNAPGKSPSLCSEFYTGWLTHWGEKIQKTDADFTAAYLEKILSKNGSVVLYMAHGGTNFGFYNGANAGDQEYDYKSDITSYDYDAPIRESGDVHNPKFEAIRRVVAKFSAASLPSAPPDNERVEYGAILLQGTQLLFDLLDIIDPAKVAESKNPVSMESVGQMFGFLLYISEYTKTDYGSRLHIPKVHDRAQVYLSCPLETGSRPTYVGTIERWSNQALNLPSDKCVSKIRLYILVENMGHLNYGQYMLDEKGILSSVYLDEKVLQQWKMVPIPLSNLNDIRRSNPISQVPYSAISKGSSRRNLENYSDNISEAPAMYKGTFAIDDANLVKDTYISFRGWGKGVAFVNGFNIGRYWPTFGPQCSLYVPAPILRHGVNDLVIFELDSTNPKLTVHSVDQPDFSCGSSKSNVRHL